VFHVEHISDFAPYSAQGIQTAIDAVPAPRPD